MHSQWMASIAPIVIGCIDYLAYGTIFTRVMFRPKMKLDVFFSARKATDERWEVVPPLSGCRGEKKLFLRFLNFDVWQGGRLSRRPFCSRRIPRIRFLSEQSYLWYMPMRTTPTTRHRRLFNHLDVSYWYFGTNHSNYETQEREKERGEQIFSELAIDR